MSPSLPVFIGIGLVVATGVMSWALSRRKRWHTVGKLSKIYLYPIKSGRYEEVTEAECTPLGLRYSTGDGKLPLRDRVFVVYKADGMIFESGKYNTKLLLINVEPKDDKTVVFSYPEKESLEVTLADEFDDKMIKMWEQEKIRINDCGDDAAKWVSEVASKNDQAYRIGYWPEKETWRRDITFQHLQLKVFKSMCNKYTGAYADLSSYHLINESSIQDLNDKLEDSNKVTVLNFRPNLVIEGPKPYEEDKWHWVKIGDVVFESFRPCTRCDFTTVNPDTTKVNQRSEPLRSLRKYRTMKMLGEDRVDPNTPVMGSYLGLHEGGRIKCGDTVYVSY